MENEPVSISDLEQSFSFVMDMLKVDKQGIHRVYILIMLEQQIGNITRRIVHPVSEFLLRSKRNGSTYSPLTLKAEANRIIPFLNWAIIKNGPNYGIHEVTDLSFEVASAYINEYAKKNKRVTVDNCEQTLRKFYYYLAKRGCLNQVTTNDFETYVNQRGQTIISCPFRDLTLPIYEQSKNLHELNENNKMLFLLTAWHYTPRIALGVYYGFYGGLRIGENVNVSRSSIAPNGPFCENGCTINLKNHDFKFETKDIASGGTVKRPRRQAIFADNRKLLVKMTKYHLEHLTSNHVDAFFIDSHGNAMSSKSFRYYFNKAKKVLIKKLMETNDIDLMTQAVYLGSAKWSSHICRGVFSNMISNNSDNVMQIAVNRGDKQPESALVYIANNEKMSKLMKENSMSTYDSILEEYFSGKGKNDG